MRRQLLLISALSGLLLYGSAAAASAASTSTGHSSAHASSGHASSGQNCVAQAEPDGSMVQPPVTCYASFSASIAAATGGRIQLPARTAPASVTSAEIASWNADPSSTFILSVDYKDANFNGPSLTWTQTQSCGSFQAAAMPNGWNDIVSSVVTSTGCANTLYKNVNFGGTTFSISRNSTVASLGSFNDQTSSEKWCTSRPC